eukprot:11024953-Ditylum_brightwellii.AAC.1
MKIDAKSLEFANQNIGNKPLPILFYMPDNYQTYKLRTNPKNKQSAVYNLMVKYYKVGTPEEWLQLMEAITQVIKGRDIQDRDVAYSLVKSLLKGDALQVFQSKEESQKIKDGLSFTKCLAAVIKHAFPKKAYKMQKKYIQNIRKLLRLGSCKWILQMIKLNDYLVHFLVPDGVTATKISCKEFIGVLEDGILYQWKLEFEKE